MPKATNGNLQAGQLSVDENAQKDLASYIQMQTSKQMQSYTSLFRPEVIQMEIDKIAQNVHLKFWLSQRKREIKHPKSCRLT